MSSINNLNIAVKELTECRVCGSQRMRRVIELPDLPLTGIFISQKEKNSSRKKYPNFNQVFLRCDECGHGQLLNSVSPSYLYQDTYTHRTSKSAISKSGNEFFYKFLKAVGRDRTFRCCLEVGCNDLYLLNKLGSICEYRYGIDPVWPKGLSREPGNIKVIGGYIEEVSLENMLSEEPDLVISAHTFEHLEHPCKALQKVFKIAAKDALFIIEVPCFDTLVTTFRFDQIFHQHINYFSTASMLHLIKTIGGEYVNHTYNFDYWNGTLLIAFRKSSLISNNELNITAPLSEDIERNYCIFRKILEYCRATLDFYSKKGIPIFAFGAAQMLPVLAYHLQTDFAEIEAILDDNPEKDSLVYPTLKPVIHTVENSSFSRNSAIIVTALDSFKAIISRLISLSPRYIVHPLLVS